MEIFKAVGNTQSYIALDTVITRIAPYFLDVVQYYCKYNIFYDEPGCFHLEILETGNVWSPLATDEHLMTCLWCHLLEPYFEWDLE